VTSLEELADIMQQSENKNRVLLRIRYGEGSRYVVLRNN
jgi:hypothetical protein